MRAANRDHALATAEAARAAGVGRFVFVSTINVVAGHRDTVLSPALAPLPLSDYGRAKAEAEVALLAMDGIEMVVLRPPLVFGPGAPGNLRALMRLCASGVPLPFGCVRNRRSMIGVTNLCGALFFLAGASRWQVAGRVFHIAEDEPFSLSAIVAECRAAMGLPSRLFCLPPRLLAGVLTLLGRAGMAEQLFGDLLVDDRSLRAAGWHPGDTAARDLSALALK
jgi:UDP-glucose 4-epimerase